MGIACVGGCDLFDPYRREAGWRPPYSNDANLRAMAAVPSDLVRGFSDLRDNGQGADQAIERQRNGTTRKTAETAVANALPSGSTESK